MSPLSSTGVGACDLRSINDPRMIQPMIQSVIRRTIHKRTHEVISPIQPNNLITPRLIREQPNSIKPYTSLRHQEGGGIRVSFLARSLRYSRTSSEQKCIVCRVDHDWRGDAFPWCAVCEIVFENREKSPLPSMWRRVAARNRRSSITLV